jgi:glycosyltransferase involved in cell wall biosynthesis
MTLRWFMRNHLIRLAAHHQVTAVADFTAEELSSDMLPGVRLVAIPIVRPIRLIADIRALLRLVRFFREERFDAVHSIMPKAGLLAMLAARVARIPHRIHCFTGQVWATQRGVKRALLKFADRVIVNNASVIMSDGFSQRRYLEAEKIIDINRAVVLGQGSTCGVDIERFRPDPTIREQVRRELDIPQHAWLILFVGRWNRDKGVLDLAQAFSKLARVRDDVWLAMVGPDEANLQAEFMKRCGEASSRVRCIDYTITAEHYMIAADIFSLPSYREGFNTAVIEAAACGIPSIASDIYGIVDSIDNGVTGLLHAPGDVEAIFELLRKLCNDPDSVKRMGEAARNNARTYFSMHDLTEAFLRFYARLLDEADSGALLPGGDIS